jgi:mannose-6-phosphate isomerase-like protein (cupin superfamily)
MCQPPAMKIVQPGRGPGRPINQFESRGAAHLGGARFDGPGGLTFIRLEPGGHLGRHPTVLTQLYCVVEGSGWVSGKEGERVVVEVGHAAIWDPGEEHESGTDTGMTVAVLEAASVRTA